MRVVSCKDCRAKLLKQAETQYAEHAFEIFENTVNSAASWTAVIALSVLKKEGKSKEELKKFFEDFCFIAGTPEVFGKEITMEDMMKKLEKELDIDFKDIDVHYEGKKKFMHRYLKNDMDKGE